MVSIHVLRFISIAAAFCLNVAGGDVSFKPYHDYSSMTSKLRQLNDAHPDISYLYKLSDQSIEGRQLWVLQLGSSAGTERGQLVPMVKFVANMHGNEVIGRELMITLAEYLLKEYEAKNTRIMKLLDTTDIHLMPSMNPDGFERATKGICRGYSHDTGRTNVEGKDLNRDFPGWDMLEKDRGELLKGRAPETQAVMRWILDRPFVLSANFHDGAVVANYPYDDSDGPGGQESPTPDNAVFKRLARTYSHNHAFMHKGSGVCEGDVFPEGITNGAHWYVVRGGMQDFNYLFSNAFELTMELSCCKYPNETQAQPEWDNNRESLLSYLESAKLGIKGVIRDKRGKPVARAKVVVEGIDKPIYTTERGEYWRLLIPGNYKVRAVGKSRHRSDWKTIYVPEPAARSLYETPQLDLVLDIHDETLTDEDMDGIDNHHNIAEDDANRVDVDAASSTSASSSTSSFSWFNQACGYLPLVCQAASYWGLA